MPRVPPENGKPVTFSQINLGQLVQRLLGPEYYLPDTGYQFSNGRRFDCSDKSTSGVYGNYSVNGRLLIEPDLTQPDMYAYGILQEDGGAIGD